MADNDFFSQLFDNQQAAIKKMRVGFGQAALILPDGKVGTYGECLELTEINKRRLNFYQEIAARCYRGAKEKAVIITADGLLEDNENGSGKSNIAGIFQDKGGTT